MLLETKQAVQQISSSGICRLAVVLVRKLACSQSRLSDVGHRNGIVLCVYLLAHNSRQTSDALPKARESRSSGMAATLPPLQGLTCFVAWLLTTVGLNNAHSYLFRMSRNSAAVWYL